MDIREKLLSARRVAGISCCHFYVITTASEEYGRDGLAQRVRRRPGSRTRRGWGSCSASQPVTLESPAYSNVRISQQPRLVRVPLSPPQVRGAWARSDQLERFDRLLWRRMAARVGPLTGQVVQVHPESRSQ